MKEKESEVLRPIALCDGKLIGIESIYTVIDGKQINDAGKVEELRVKASNNELFCPCGCGANLTVVAGKQMLKKQHFRMKNGVKHPDCCFKTERKVSVDSKIVLKCWLDENIHTKDLESRVPISAVSDSSRKYEFTFLSREKKIAINYCYDQANLSDEKLQILDDNSKGVHIIHIVGNSDSGNSGQYPEWLMKVQSKQGYCLLLSVSDAYYDKAILKAVFYEQDLDGLWKEVSFSDAPLKDYRISHDGSLLCREVLLSNLVDSAKDQFHKNLDIEKSRRDELQKKQEELAAKNKRIKEENDRKIEEDKKNKELEQIRIKEEKERAVEEFKQNVEEYLSQQKTKVFDPEGKRWFRCEYCGKIGPENEFKSYGGGIYRINIGTCGECMANNPDVVKTHQTVSRKKKTVNNLGECPDCHKKLVEKTGKYGKFIGCTGFPTCTYTRSIF